MDALSMKHSPLHVVTKYTKFNLIQIRFNALDWEGRSAQNESQMVAASSTDCR